MKIFYLSIFLWLFSYNAYAILDIEWNSFVQNTVQLDSLIYDEMIGNSGNLSSNYKEWEYEILTDFINAVDQSRDPHANRMLKAANINEAESLLSQKQWLFNASQKFERYFSQNPSYIDKKTALELKRYISFLKLLSSQRQFNAGSFQGIKNFLINKIKKTSIFSGRKGIYFLDVVPATLPTKPKVLRFNSRNFDISVIKNPRYRKSQQPQQSISQNPRQEELSTTHFSDSQQYPAEQGDGAATYISPVNEKVAVEIFLDGSRKNFSFELRSDFFDKYRDTLQSLCKKSTIKEISVFTNSGNIQNTSAECVNVEMFSSGDKDYTVNIFRLKSTITGSHSKGQEGSWVFLEQHDNKNANGLMSTLKKLNEQYQ